MLTTKTQSNKKLIKNITDTFKDKKVPLRILLLSYCLPDGIGDVVHALNVFKDITEHYNLYGIEVSALIFGNEGKINRFLECCPEAKKLENFVAIGYDAKLEIGKEMFSDNIPFKNAVMKITETVDKALDEKNIGGHNMLLTVSTSLTACSHLYKPIIAMLNSKKILLPYYFAYSIPEFNPETSQGNMGSSKIASLESTDHIYYPCLNELLVQETPLGLGGKYLGFIFSAELQSFFKNETLESVENSKLAKLLMIIKGNEQENALGYAYTKSSATTTLFLASAMKTAHKEKNVILLYTGSCLDEKFLGPIGKVSDFDRIKYYQFDTTNQMSIVNSYDKKISGNNPKRTCHIIYVPAFSAKDAKLMLKSSNIVSAQGDSSFVELVLKTYFSNKEEKIFPIILLPLFKKNLLNELCKLANTIDPHKASIFSKYCNQLFDLQLEIKNMPVIAQAETITKKMMDLSEENKTAIIEIWRDICEIIYEKHNYLLSLEQIIIDYLIATTINKSYYYFEKTDYLPNSPNFFSKIDQSNEIEICINIPKKEKIEKIKNGGLLVLATAYSSDENLIKLLLQQTEKSSLAAKANLLISYCILQGKQDILNLLLRTINNFMPIFQSYKTVRGGEELALYLNPLQLSIKMGQFDVALSLLNHQNFIFSLTYDQLFMAERRLVKHQSLSTENEQKKELIRQILQLYMLKNLSIINTLGDFGLGRVDLKYIPKEFLSNKKLIYMFFINPHVCPLSKDLYLISNDLKTDEQLFMTFMRTREIASEARRLFCEGAQTPKKNQKRITTENEDVISTKGHSQVLDIISKAMGKVDEVYKKLNLSSKEEKFDEHKYMSRTPF